MGRRYVEVDLQCDVAALWSAYEDPHRWPSWSPQIVSVDYPHSNLVAQTEGRVHGPLGLKVPFRILHVTSTEWSWRVGLGTVVLVMTHGVEPRGGPAQGSRATLEMRGPALVLALYAPFARYALSRIDGVVSRSALGR